LLLTLLGADVTGTWNFSVDTGQGTGNPTFTFKQDGEKLTGKYSGIFGSADVSGTVKGDAIEFKLNVEYEGQKGEIVYTGSVVSATEMKGKVVFTGLGEGTWTAKKTE
jgi:hypothetical protein